MAVPPTRAVTVPASSSRQSRTVNVRLEPFWAISSWGPGVTTAPLRSQVTSASGGETSHRNVASSPSWTVSGVSSETSFTSGGSGGRRSGGEVGRVFPHPSHSPSQRVQALAPRYLTDLFLRPTVCQPQGCPKGLDANSLPLSASFSKCWPGTRLSDSLIIISHLLWTLPIPFNCHNGPMR